MSAARAHLAPLAIGALHGARQASRSRRRALWPVERLRPVADIPADSMSVSDAPTSRATPLGVAAPRRDVDQLVHQHEQAEGFGRPRPVDGRAPRGRSCSQRSGSPRLRASTRLLPERLIANQTVRRAADRSPPPRPGARARCRSLPSRSASSARLHQLDGRGTPRRLRRARARFPSGACEWPRGWAQARRGSSLPCLRSTTLAPARACRRCSSSSGIARRASAAALALSPPSPSVVAAATRKAPCSDGSSSSSRFKHRLGDLAGGRELSVIRPQVVERDHEAGERGG